ncbi:MAG: VOC family protein [Chloroflexi bacterium]|nr:VOC family protein [Chloroflexota bacterium]
MFEKIQHIGYLTPDLDGAIAWFEEKFGAVKAGGGPLAKGYAMPSGGRNAYVRFGNAEAELLEPEDRTGLSSEVLTMHHVGYVVADIDRSIDELTARGFKFAADKPNTNVLGHRLLYFDSTTTNGVKMHITQLPGQMDATGIGAGLEVEKIIHAGYRVKNLETAIKWYVDNFQGEHIGGGPSRTGARNAFVNFSQVQVELIEPTDPATMGDDHVMDHVGYVVGDIPSCIGECESHGLAFVSDTPNTNSVGQQVLYFETDTSMGSRMHLTRLPD